MHDDPAAQLSGANRAGARQAEVSLDEVETTALGAAMQAAAASGALGSIQEAADGMSGEGATYSPDEATAARYDRLYTDVYKEIYPRVAPVFKALDALRG